MNCDCYDKLDKLLQDNPDTANTKIECGISIDFKTGDSKTFFVISTVKRNSRTKQKARTIFATHCPFCGVKCHEDKPLPVDPEQYLDTLDAIAADLGGVRVREAEDNNGNH